MQKIRKQNVGVGTAKGDRNLKRPLIVFDGERFPSGLGMLIRSGNQPRGRRVRVRNPSDQG